MAYITPNSQGMSNNSYPYPISHRDTCFVKIISYIFSSLLCIDLLIGFFLYIYLLTFRKHSISPILAICSAHLILLDIINPIILGNRYKL